MPPKRPVRGGSFPRQEFRQAGATKEYLVPGPERALRRTYSLTRHVDAPAAIAVNNRINTAHCRTVTRSVYFHGLPRRRVAATYPVGNGESTEDRSSVLSERFLYNTSLEQIGFELSTVVVGGDHQASIQVQDKYEVSVVIFS